MMYSNRAAIAVKVNGKVLREFKDTVYIPFGSEYSILIKNLNTKRGIFHVFLDGDDVVPNGLVLNAGQEVDLERWIKNGNLSEGNRFKFIERTGAIEDHRGIKIEDGLIRVEFQFERDYPKPYYPNYHYNNGLTWTDPTYWDHNTLLRSVASGQVAKGMATSAMNAATHQHPGVACSSMSAGASLNNMVVGSAQSFAQNDVGITVPGSKSEQKFTTVSNFSVESEKHSMILKLLGETEDNKPVIAPVTVHTKVQCTTCNRKNKTSARFCSSCGTSLTIYA